MSVTVVALIPAAGFGTRFHDAGPKALVRLAGKPFLVHALERLAASGASTGPSWPSRRGTRPPSPTPSPGSPRCRWRRRRAARRAATRSSPPGGPRRAGDDDLLCVHDAARPLVDPADVAAVVAAAAEYGAALAGSPVTDTIKRVRDGVVVETVPRHDLFAAATPQVMRAGLFREAVEAGLSKPPTTSSSSRGAASPVRTVVTSRWNVKITFPEDLARAEAWLAAAGRPMSLRIGQGLDAHPLVAGAPLRPRRGRDPLRRGPGGALRRRRRPPRARRRAPRDGRGGGPRERLRDDRPGVEGRPVVASRHRGAREGGAARRS